MVLAQPATDCAAASSATVWSEPAENDGASFTKATVIANVCGALVSTPPFAVPPSSWARTVTVAEPCAEGAGVKVSVPSTATAGCAANRPELSFVTRNDTDWADSSAGPGVIAVAHAETDCAPASSATDWSAPAANDGAEFTGVRVIAKVSGEPVSSPPFALPPSSTGLTVTVVVPFAPAAGVKVSAPSAATAG